MRILLASRFLPEPPQNGAIIRTNCLWRALQSLGEVDLALVHRFGGLSEIEERARARFPQIVAERPGLVDLDMPFWLRPVQLLHAKAAERLRVEVSALRDFSPDKALREDRVRPIDWSRYDVVVSRHLSPACRLGALEQRPPVVIDLDDAPHLLVSESEVGRSAPSWPTRVKRQMLYRTIARRLRRCAHVFFVSEEDRRRSPVVRGSVLRNIPLHIPTEAPPWGASSSLVLFVGTFEHAPNREGIAHFIGRIWPDVRREVPAARLRLVGTVAEADRKRWSSEPGVDVAGRVDDLQPHYAEAVLCIAPIYFGGGTNIKVAEAAAQARVSVVTPFGHRGWEQDLPHGQCLLCANTDEEFASHVTALLRDPSRAAGLGKAAHAAAREHCSYARFAAVVRNGITAACDSQGAKKHRER